MGKWIAKTAWPMTPPAPYSSFHLLFASTGFLIAFLAAWLLRKSSLQLRLGLLFFLGILLAISEVYKQFFLYYIVNQGNFDWWYFPFQLCSLPMYLCLLLPFLGKRGQRILCTFLYDYNLLGAFMAFIDPSGFMHPYWTLTLHSFLWHIILIFIGLLVVLSGMTGRSFQEFCDATAIFIACCVIATGINVISHPYGNANMFYITPYSPSTQILYSKISSVLGIIPGNLIYLLSILLGAGLLHLMQHHKKHARKR